MFEIKDKSTTEESSETNQCYNNQDQGTTLIQGKIKLPQTFNCLVNQKYNEKYMLLELLFQTMYS